MVKEFIGFKIANHLCCYLQSSTWFPVLETGVRINGFYKVDREPTGSFVDKLIIGFINTELYFLIKQVSKL